MACRPAPTCSLGATSGFVANKLAGARLHTLPGGRTVVPLLHPQQHGLPFLLTLELHSAAPAAAVAQPPPALDRDLYALHYVLAGSGQLVRASGGAEQLQAGDSVLMHSGAAACRAGSAGGSTDGPNLLEGSPWQLAALVAYMPRQLFEQQQQQQQQQQGKQQQAQAGQPLEEQAWARMLHSARLQPLLQAPSSGNRADGGSSSSSSSSSSDAAAARQLPEEFVGALLAGARETARQLLLQDQQQQSGSESTNRSSSRLADSGSNSSSSSPGLPLPAAVQAAASSVAGWWAEQQQRTCPVTKRTLSELTAFRLPNQTNRLAVQFDPFSRPQVPFISGIEVFERGHRTTPHVHPHAHELFFILAGEGVGFCGDHRFPVTAGDVVVFRPGAVHGIDNGDASRMYCLELMVPNEAFAEFVRAGEDTGSLSGDDLCVLAAIGCR
ncbi:hypothetical protein ABPG75_012577 [Micractinium tetrahymenae]